MTVSGRRLVRQSFKCVVNHHRFPVTLPSRVTVCTAQHTFISDTRSRPTSFERFYSRKDSFPALGHLDLPLHFPFKMTNHQNYRSKVIELTDVERTLKRLLLDVAEYIDSTISTKSSAKALPAEVKDEKIVLRWTGGWVRDKLLGVGSHDIDVAINKMTGYDFGVRMKEYLEVPGNAAKYGVDARAAGLHKIEANPEKSKHLETVTTKILGLDIDLVNLRKETYTEESRNPQMEFGTAEEDALRRDATVNAMFYNLSTSEIEDLTNRGFDDMEAQIIRTPLEPYQTFKDDPLRVLRLIRFATRLGYNIDAAAQEAMNNQDIRDSLRIKISRERVGIELEKMLRGKDPRGALEYIDRLDLYTTIFTDPTSKPIPKDQGPQTKSWNHVYDYLGSLLDGAKQEASPSSDAIHILLAEAESRYQAWVSACIVPWFDVPMPPPPKKNKRPVAHAVAVAREGFKAPNKVADVVDQSMQNLAEIKDLKDKSNDQATFPHKRKQGPDATSRDVLGMAIRRWGASWKQQVMFAMMSDILEKPESVEGKKFYSLRCFTADFFSKTLKRRTMTSLSVLGL